MYRMKKYAYTIDIHQRKKLILILPFLIGSGANTPRSRFFSFKIKGFPKSNSGSNFGENGFYTNSTPLLLKKHYKGYISEPSHLSFTTHFPFQTGLKFSGFPLISYLVKHEHINPLS